MAKRRKHRDPRTGKKIPSSVLYKNGLTRVQDDLYTPVMRKCSNVSALFNRIDESKLSPSQQELLDGYRARLGRIVSDFKQLWTVRRQQLAEKVKKLKALNLIRKIAEVVLVIAGFILLFTGLRWLGVLLIIATLIAQSVLKKIFAEKALKISRSNYDDISSTYKAIGEPAKAGHPATGLYAEVESLWLSTLDPQTRRRALQEQTDTKRRNSAALQRMAQTGSEWIPPELPTGRSRSNEALDAAPGIGECDICGTLLSYNDLYVLQSCPNPDCTNHGEGLIMGRDVLSYEDHMDTGLTPY